MLVHWESSQRPLFVRTVWVGGHRHAILSSDDPAASPNALAAGLQQSRAPRLISPSSSPTTARSICDNLFLSATSQPLCENINNKQSKGTSLRSNQELFRTDGSSKEDQSIDRNPLSERVLQWLDLAGKTSLFSFTVEHDPNRLSKSRHSVPEVKNIGSGLYIAEQMATHKKKRSNSKKSYATDGDEDTGAEENSSLVSDNIQNYAKASYGNDAGHANQHSRTVLPSNVITFQEEHCEPKTRAAKPKNKGKKFPMTASLSVSSGVDSDEDEDSDAAIPSNRRCSLQTEAFEREYIDIIRKKIVETSFNPTAARRQLHIFMPSLPKKSNDESVASSTLTNDDV